VADAAGFPGAGHSPLEAVQDGRCEAAFVVVAVGDARDEGFGAIGQRGPHL